MFLRRVEEIGGFGFWLLRKDLWLCFGLGKFVLWALFNLELGSVGFTHFLVVNTRVRVVMEPLGHFGFAGGSCIVVTML